MTNGPPFDFFNDNKYEHGFCECYRAPVPCLLAYCVPCVAVGNTTGKLDKEGFNIWSCLCWPIAAYRNRRNVQARANIVESEDGTMVAQDMHEAKRLMDPVVVVQPTAIEIPANGAPVVVQRM